MIRQCLFALLVCGSRVLAQTGDSTSLPDTLAGPIGSEVAGVENLLEQFQNESDDLQLLDELTWRQEHPYDLNTISREELESIPGVTPQDAARLIDFRKTVKRISAVEQLQVFDGQLYDKVAPFVTVTDERSYVRLRSRTSRDLQPRRGAMDNTFAGSSVKSYGSVTAGAGDVEAGVLFEKDGGERVSNGFVSGYASVKEISFLSQLLVGDFKVSAGQGLVLWKGTSFGKGSESASVAKKSGLGAQPYRSTDEFNFFRGAAVASSFGFVAGRLDVTAFISRRLLDATIDPSEGVSGFYEDGMFRTESELQKQKAVSEQVAGGRVQFVGTDGWNIGSTAFRAIFDKPLIADRVYEFSGLEQSVVGFDAAVTKGRVSAFGEIARSGDNGVAGIVGSVVNVGSNSNIALIYRDYGPAFNNFHASGFGERSNTKNERGFYFGVGVQARKGLRLSGYIDLFKFPYRTYLDPLPTSGHEILVQADAAFTPKFDLSVRFTRKATEGAEAGVDVYGRETRLLVGRIQNKYRLTATFKATPRVSVKGRLEFTEVDYDQLRATERGYLLYQDIRYGISNRFSIEGRLAFFHTDSYDSRLYEYENDLRGVFSNPALYGKGRRWYMVIRYYMAGVLTLSAKYSETQKEGVTSLGSGTTEIYGDLDNRLSLQFDINL
jgi:hypothetical protein